MTDLSRAKYGIVIAKDIMISMRDGVRLAADIYFPAENGERISGKLPTILGRTSYDKTWPELWVEPVANFFAPRGYAVVLQDLRGRHKSDGTGQYHHTANMHEGEDGYDTIEWIASQSWSNGKVGMTGSSHGGIVQTAASLTRPPHLSAIWVDVAPTNIFAHQSREGGAMSLQMFGALFLHAYDSQEIRDDPIAKRRIIEGWTNIEDWVLGMPFKPGKTPLSEVPNLEKVLFHYYYDGEYNDFWDMEICNQEPHFHKAADIPGVFSGGWYDPFAVAMTNQYVVMSGQNKSPQHLIMGPWIHNGMRSGITYSGDIDFGEDSAYGPEIYNTRRLRWFDKWLKNIDNGVELDPAVQIFVMGGGDGRKNSDGKLNHGGIWRTESEWPIARTNHVEYYLGSNGKLSPEPPGLDEPSLSYIHDPAGPVPTIASSITALSRLAELPSSIDYVTPRDRIHPLVINGGAHQAESSEHFGSSPPYVELRERKDILVFQSDLLKEDVEITGSILVTLWVSSNATDTDFTAKLLDIYPPTDDYPSGYHLNLADSVIRTRYRNGFNEAQMMDPGKVYRVNIQLPPISNLFKEGHFIRLDIASSNFPKYDVNPNTGEALGRHTHMIKAVNTVYMDHIRPSNVIFPIVPKD